MKLYNDRKTIVLLIDKEKLKIWREIQEVEKKTNQSLLSELVDMKIYNYLKDKNIKEFEKTMEEF